MKEGRKEGSGVKVEAKAIWLSVTMTKMTSFLKSWYTACSFCGWILKTWQGENDGYSCKN